MLRNRTPELYPNTGVPGVCRRRGSVHCPYQALSHAELLDVALGNAMAAGRLMRSKLGGAI